MKSGPILLIDDDKDDHELMQDMLREENIASELLWFKNGKEALDYLKSTTEPPLLILTDINMPVMGGIELRRLINEDEELKRKSIPFIFLTTSAAQHAVIEAYKMCVQGFFEKRTSMKGLRTMIRLIYDYWQLCRHPNN